MAEERLADLAVSAMYYKERVPVDEVGHALYKSSTEFVPSLFVL